MTAAASPNGSGPNGGAGSREPGPGRRYPLSVVWSAHEKAIVELAAKRLGTTRSEIIRRGSLALAEAIAAGEDTPSGVNIRVADLVKMVN